MTSQPDYPTTDRTGIDEDALDTEQAARDPDLIVVAGEVIEEDADPDAPDTGYLAGESLPKDDLAEDDMVEDDLTEDDLTEDDLTEDDLTEDELTGIDVAGDDMARSDRDDYPVSGSPGMVEAGIGNGRTADDHGQAPDLGREWHDIQAMFVDDPRGSVELAAAAADAAVSALVQTLHERQSALSPAGSTSADPGGTEELREALLGYRIFCQSLSEVGQHIAQPTTMTR